MLVINYILFKLVTAVEMFFEQMLRWFCCLTKNGIHRTLSKQTFRSHEHDNNKNINKHRLEKMIFDVFSNQCWLPENLLVFTRIPLAPQMKLFVWLLNCAIASFSAVKINWEMIMWCKAMKVHYLHLLSNNKAQTNARTRR